MWMSHRLLNKYLFLFNVGGLLYILIELIWRGRNHDIRVLNRLHRQSGSRLERLGLQRDAGQSLGADLSAVLCAVAAGGTGRDRSG